ncbi:MAG: crossover junction endodeoxyribonuclease RuvC, partial [Ignavibacteriaceae bacterium]|nr:crossover junction endodeoxyribonuclease RuvC [Ignavibacteriaceae bacterium]
MIILGVDPGTIVTGYGIIEYTNNKFRRISHGVIKLPSTKSLSEKIEIIYAELDNLLKMYKPDEFAIETAFYGKNVQSVLKIGYA